MSENKAIAGGYGSQMIGLTTKFPFLKVIIKFLYPPMPTLNTIPRKEIEELKKIIFNGGKTKVLNVGCGSMVGCGKRLWVNVNTKNVLNIDIETGPGVDIVGDAHNLPFDDESFDSVIMQAVIEHLHSPHKAVSESFRVLKKGGFLYLEVPFLQGFHADPYDFQRYTTVGLEKLTDNFSLIIKKGVSVGPICSIIWILRDLFSNLTKNKWINGSIRFVLSWLLAPLRYIDHIIYSTKATKRLACEYYILVQK
jgi:SAM-dependent methyltransferase